MKKIMCTALAVLVAAPAVASAQDRGDRRQERIERRQERLERREDRREERGADASRQLRRNWGDNRIDRRQDRLERREDRLERREDRRDDRRDWNRGYNQPRHYYYPAPSYNYYYYTPPRSYNYYPSRPYYNYGYSYGPSYGYGYNYNYYQPRWYRGAVLPFEYRRRYYVPNYNYYGWAPPPPGYAYYRTDTGEILLAAIATGIILSVIAGAF